MAHQPVRAARFIPEQCLHHHAKGQVRTFLQILLSQLTREKEPDSLRDYSVQLPYRPFLAPSNSLHQFIQGRPCRSERRRTSIRDWHEAPPSSAAETSTALFGDEDLDLQGSRR